MSQTNPLTDLDAINEMLASVGQAPITSIETTTNLYEKVGDEYKQLTITTSPDVAMAQQTLSEVSRMVQSEGWAFNIEYNYPLSPDATTKRIKYTDRMLQVDLNTSHPSYGNLDTVKREGWLYERNHHTFEWEGTIYCDILWLFDWEDIPRPIQDYVIKRASAILSMRIVGDPNLYKVLDGQALNCRAYALEYDTQQGDYTYFGHPQGQNYYQSYKPFHTLYR